MLDVQGCDDEVGLDYHYIGSDYRYTRPTVGTPGGGSLPTVLKVYRVRVHDLAPFHVMLDDRGYEDRVWLVYLYMGSDYRYS